MLCIHPLKGLCTSIYKWLKIIFTNSEHVFFLLQFFGDQTADSVLQQEVQRHAGFHIEDLASCTVIRHVSKGTSTLTLITNAPSNSLIMEKLLQGHSSSSEEGDWWTVSNLHNISTKNKYCFLTCKRDSEWQLASCDVTKIVLLWADSENTKQKCKFIFKI